MAYSAVSQPSPRPRRQPGTPSSTETVQSTRVRPNETRHEPSALGAACRSSEMARSASDDRPTRTGSDFGFATESGDDAGGGLTSRQRDDVNGSPPRTHLRRSDDGVLAVVAALHEDVGPQVHDQLERRVLLEHDDAVD